jgi:hypothetical protein
MNYNVIGWHSKRKGVPLQSDPVFATAWFRWYMDVLLVRTGKLFRFFGIAVFLCQLAPRTGAFTLPSMGPIYAVVPQTLGEGTRTEMLGPLIHTEHGPDKSGWGFCPLVVFRKDNGTDSSEFDLLYPVLTGDRFGKEYRFQILQMFSVSTSNSQEDQKKKRFTLFPIYFQQRSPDPKENYTALVPIYGHLKNRLFRDEVKFIMLPLYLQSRKRDVVTDNYLFPFFHLRHGAGLRGWQAWPIVGKEHKDVTTFTNRFDDVETSPGHDKFFALWPFYFNNTLGIGSTNETKQKVLIPFYSNQKSPARDSKTFGFPLGYTKTIEREKQYTEWDAPYPLVVFARGEGKRANRIWPFFSQAKTPLLESDFYLWPLYKFNRATSEPLDRTRTRILFFLYSDTIEKNTATGSALHRTDLFPLFTARQDHNGDKRLQVFTFLEPFLPTSKSIERDYSILWSIWRSEYSAKKKLQSDSFLWNLYRADKSPESKKYSLLFGSFGYQEEGNQQTWRLFFIPFHRQIKSSPAAGGSTRRAEAGPSR